MTQHPEQSRPTKLPEHIRMQGVHVISGAGRGKGLGIPTINLTPHSAPKDLAHGIYACFVHFDDKRLMGAMHYGPRPVFKDSESLEVHILDSDLRHAPEKVDLTIVGRIRDVTDFPDVPSLLKRIEQDIRETRAMLTEA